MRAGQDTPWLKKEKRVLKRCAKRGQGNRDHLEATGLCASGIPSDGGLTRAARKCKGARVLNDIDKPAADLATFTAGANSELTD